MMQAPDGRRSSGYLRAIGHLRRLLAWLPPVVLSQRLISWKHGATPDHIARNVAAMLTAQP